MKTDSTAITKPETDYINLSESLREELELKIETLHKQSRFIKYTSTRMLNYENDADGDLLCAYLIGELPRNYALSGKLLQGIKTWFSMYYDDRLSVMDKFRTGYRKAKPENEHDDWPGVSIVFCKFLMRELLTILADSRWEILISYAD